MKRLALISLPLLLSACSSVTNTSLLDGSQQFGRTDMKLEPVYVLAIDKDYTIDTNPVRVEPGKRLLYVAAAPAWHFNQPVYKNVPFTVEACKRYYLAARRENRLKQDFELVVQEVEDRGDCVKQ